MKGVIIYTVFAWAPDRVTTPLKIDISTGDAITPREMKYRFKLMLEDRTIKVLAYNLETILAEKLETIIARNVTNTRMRDFYNIYVLLLLYDDTLDHMILYSVLIATANKRGTTDRIIGANDIFDDVENSENMKKLWKAYQKKFSDDNDIQWEKVMGAVRTIYLIMG